MKVLLTAFLIYFNFGPLSAQSNSEKARELLDKVYEKVSSYDNIYIGFKYELLNKDAGTHQEMRGDVTLQNDKYLFNYMGASQMYDGKKVYTVVPENEEVVIDDLYEDEAATITPSKMLTFYKDGYNYEWGALKNENGRKIQYVRLMPIDSRSEIKEIQLGIDARTHHIYKLIETGNSDLQTVITVNSFKTDQPLSETFFIFNTKKFENEGYYISRN